MNFTVPDGKSCLYALTYIPGLGIHAVDRILAKLDIDNGRKIETLSEVEMVEFINQAREFGYLLGKDLFDQVKSNILRKIRTGIYSGHRHVRHLPVRGQRTSSNASNAKKLCFWK